MARRSLRVLCFGDSLTSGWCYFGSQEHPYAERLRQKLKATFPGVDVEVVTDGEPGAVASAERFQRRMIEQFKNNSYDWVIVLGGTNDFAYGITPNNIYSALAKVWNIALLKHAKVLALTVPEGRSRFERIVKKRDELNLKILTHQQPGYYFFDLESHIPYHSLTKAERDKYWDDGLHLQPDGYDWMGEHIATGLIRILKLEGHLETPDGNAKTEKSSVRTTGTDDDYDDAFTCTEEEGNPKDISQGYVVVRKRDLD